MVLTVSGCVLCAPSSCVPLCTLLSYSSKLQEWETEAIAPVFMIFCNARSHRQYLWPGSGLNNRGVIAGNIRRVSHCCHIYTGCVVHPISFNVCKWLFLQKDKRLAFAADYWHLSWSHQRKFYGCGKTLLFAYCFCLLPIWCVLTNPKCLPVAESIICQQTEWLDSWMECGEA